MVAEKYLCKGPTISENLNIHVYIYTSPCIGQTARYTWSWLQPLGGAGHVPGNVVDPELRRQELVEVEDSWVELFTQDLFMFPFFPFL